MEFFQGIFTIAFVAILIAIVIAYHKRKKEKDSIPNKSAHKTCFDKKISEEFDIEDGVLKKYTGTSATVRIPNGVTQIGAEAFRKNTKLKRVHLPDSVRILGWNSFSGCTYLEQINIPINIEEVSQYAFSMCRLLRSAGMSSRFNIILDDAMDAIPDNLFRGMICLSEVSLPQKIKSIGKNAFYNCEKIKKIALPQNVKHIEEYAFSKCSGLQEIILPPSLETVGASAFSDCKNLRSVVCQNNNTKFGTQAFFNCRALQDKDGFVIINQELFAYYGTASDLSIPDNVIRINGPVFAGNHNLVSLTFPRHLEKIPDSMCSGCYNLERIVFPEDGLRVIGRSAFGCCRKLKEAVLTDGLETIENKAFDACVSLCKLIVPDTVKTVASDGFSNCGRIENIMIGENAPDTLKRLVERSKEAPACSEDDPANAFLKTCDLSEEQDIVTFSAYLNSFFPGGNKYDDSTLFHSYRWSFSDNTLKVSLEETRDGMHDLHDSYESISVREIPNKTEGWIPFTEEIAKESVASTKLLEYFAGCEGVFVESENIWHKDGYYYCSNCPGTAEFCVHNPPGLNGWFIFRYSDLWD